MLNKLTETKNFTLLDSDVWTLFVRPGEIIEIRIVEAFGKNRVWGGGFAKGIVSGYFDNHQDFCKHLIMADQVDAAGVYITLQVIDPRLIGRALNRLKAAKMTTSDKYAIFYRWLPVDIDPNRPAGISSSDSELKMAMDTRELISEWVVKNLGLPAPMKGMSGNGAHLLFPLPDLEANEESEAFVKKTLEGLSKRFSNENVSVDTTVYNRAQIWKAYGTTARKGDQVPANQYRKSRPHRASYIDTLPEAA